MAQVISVTITATPQVDPGSVLCCSLSLAFFPFKGVLWGVHLSESKCSLKANYDV